MSLFSNVDPPRPRGTSSGGNGLLRRIPAIHRLFKPLSLCEHE